MSPWIPAIITIVINIAAIAFAFGKVSQSVTDMKRRLGLSDEAMIRKNGKDDSWKQRWEDREPSHQMLTVCSEAFEQIRKQLNNLDGKVDTLIGRG